MLSARRCKIDVRRFFSEFNIIKFEQLCKLVRFRVVLCTKRIAQVVAVYDRILRQILAFIEQNALIIKIIAAGIAVIFFIIAA